MKIAPGITLDEQERAKLLLWLRVGSARLANRARIVLLAAEGKTNEQIAAELRASPKTVSLWRRRFVQRRLAGIETESPRGKSGATHRA